MEKIKIMELEDITYAFTHSSLAKGLEMFNKEGFKMCSLKDIARLRLAESRRDGGIIYADSNFTAAGISSKFDEGPITTREGILIFPGKNFHAKIVRNSPILGDLDNMEFTYYPTDEQISEALKNSTDYPSYTKGGKNVSIRTRDFGKNKLAIWAFGAGDEKIANSYGCILNDSSIDSIAVHCAFRWDEAEKKKRPYLHQVYYGKPWDDFHIYMGGSGYGWNPEYMYAIKESGGSNSSPRDRELNTSNLSGIKK